MTVPTPPCLLLTKQTFVALTDGLLVFLDLRRDKYSCLEPRHTRAVAPLLGLPTVEDDDGTELLIYQKNKEVAQVIQDLIDNSLVTRDLKNGKRAELIEQPGELREMLGYMPGEGPKVRAHHVTNFFKALIVTLSLLKFASMKRIVMRVKRRREQFSAKGGTEPEFERINELVEIYKILKPLIVTVKDHCIFSSLFLIEFLAGYRVYPNWYFGVRLNEFYAHCWAQGGHVIYDDFIVNTCRTQPIMVV